MAKEIKFTMHDREYTLKFTLRTVQQMSREGFSVEQLDVPEGVAIHVPKLVCGAFKAMHPRLQESTIMDEIYPDIADKKEFLQKLTEMYASVITALVEGDEESEGNVQWEMTE